jgi:hypothetical protein
MLDCLDRNNQVGAFWRKRQVRAIEIGLYQLLVSGKAIVSENIDSDIPIEPASKMPPQISATTANINDRCARRFVAIQSCRYGFEELLVAASTRWNRAGNCSTRPLRFPRLPVSPQ